MLVRSLAFALLLAVAAPIAAAQNEQSEQPAPKIDAIENPELPPPPEIQPTPPAPTLEPQTEPQITEPEAVPPQSPSGGNQAPMIHGRLALSLEDALKMGLENNLDVQVERYSPLIAEMDAAVAWGAFEPTASADFGYHESQIPNSNVLFGTKESVNRDTGGSGGLGGLLPLLGTQYNAQFDSDRLTTNNAIETLSPKYTSGWRVDVT